jgi:hypothetical protein
VNSELLIGGLRLVCGVDNLLAKYVPASPGLPPGKFRLVDKENRPDTADVTRNNLSTRFDLMYIELAEAA